MSLPYENSTTGEKAVAEIRKVLKTLGATQFGVMEDSEDQCIIVQFKYGERQVMVRASIKGYAAAWLREHPYNSSRHRKTRAQYEQRAMDQGALSVYSILRDWIKGQCMAIHCGILSFEGAFLGQIMLPSGETVLDQIKKDKLLPAPSNDDS